MVMRFASLGSGSSGNALVIEAGETRLLLDCGFGIRESVRRLERLGLAPGDLSGILVTHEHDDHVGGVFKLAARYRIPVHITHGTLSVLRDAPVDSAFPLSIIDSHTPFAIGALEVMPFPVPHDAREPVQYVLSDGLYRLGVLTDTGMSTPHTEAMLSGCHALVLECNHDTDMLMNGNYPWSLKQRINSRHGHLSNHAAAKLLAKLDISKLQHLVAAHLSAQNNTPQLARTALSSAIHCEDQWIAIADQDEGLGWREIT